MSDNRRNISLLVLLALAIAFPLVVSNDYIKHVVIIALIYSILATSLNLVSGYTGLLSLGQQAFYGIGGYTSALLMMRLGFPFLVSLLCAGLFAMLWAWFIGKVTFRLRSSFYTISTVAFAKILELVCVNWVELTQGPMGLTNIPPPSILGFEFSSINSKYYLILVLAVLCIFVAYRIIHSHIGRVFKCVADAEYVCKATGANVNHYLMIAVMAGGFMAGIAGSFYAHYSLIISPDMFYFQVAINIVVMLVAGGLGTFSGPIVGAFIFTVLPEVMRFSQEYSYIFYGIILMLVVRFLPGGIVSLFSRKPAVNPLVRLLKRKEKLNV